MPRAVGDHDLEEIAQLAIATGARLGELCALRWRDVTITTGVVTFLAVASKERGRTVRIDALKAGPPKTLRVDDGCRAMLERRYARHLAEAEAAGVPNPIAFMDDVAVCSRMLERDATSAPAVSGRWRRAAERAPSTLRFHDLRHLAISAMMAGGLSPVATAARAGHASPKMTLDVYGHLFAAEDDRATTILDAVWRAAGA